MSDDAGRLRDEVALLRRSLDDARREHARGDLGDDALATIEHREGARLAELAQRLAQVPPIPDATDEATRPAPRVPVRSRRLVLTCTAVLVAAAGTIGVVVGRPFAGASPKVHLDRAEEIQVLLVAAERYVATHDDARALTAYDAVLRLDPRDAEAFIESGWLRYEAGVTGHRRGEAALGAALLRRSVVLYPRNAASHLYDGIVLLQRDHDRLGARAQVLTSASLPESAPEASLTAEVLDYLDRG